jgi:hypothetical protein
MRAMTKDEADAAWKDFPYRGDGDDWAAPVAAEFWRLRAVEEEMRAALAKAEQERDNLRAEMNAYVHVAIEAAQILAGEGGPLGEGVVAGARRVVAERDAMRECLASAEASIEAVQMEHAATREERDAAVADNAALLKLWQDTGCLDLGPRVEREDPSSCIEQGWPLDGIASCTACRALGQPHPGTALLEQHKKALEHARNEGLERAAADCLSRAGVAEEFGHMDAGETWRCAALSIRAMKEPEE